MKKLWKYFFISILILLIGCTPRAVQKPDIYSGPELSLDELTAKVNRDVDLLKAIADIEIEKNNSPYDFIKASVLLKKPDGLHMRVYKLGVLVRDFIVQDNVLYVLSGKREDKLKRLGTELHNSIFWWDHLESGTMRTANNEYIIKAGNREIHLDKTTLLPLRQFIVTSDKKISVTYDQPVKSEGLWYHSLMKIDAGSYRFTVTLKKILWNPSLGDNDFRLPIGG